MASRGGASFCRKCRNGLNDRSSFSWLDKKLRGKGQPEGLGCQVIVAVCPYLGSSSRRQQSVRGTHPTLGEVALPRFLSCYASLHRGRHAFGMSGGDFRICFGSAGRCFQNASHTSSSLAADSVAAVFLPLSDHGRSAERRSTNGASRVSVTADAFGSTGVSVGLLSRCLASYL